MQRPSPAAALRAAALEDSRRLLARTHHDGLWSYTPGQEPSLEATAWASIALSGREPVCELAAERLIGCQNDDGGWPTTPNSGAPSDWNSALALLCLRLAEPHLSERLQGSLARVYAAGIDFMLSSRGVFHGLSDLASLVQLGIVLLSPGSPCGFPWDPGTYYWTEPTGYGILALKPHARGKSGGRSEELATQLHRAEEFLLEHACRKGGWNHGNFVSLGKNVPAYPPTTAIALIALQDRAAAGQVAGGLAYLEGAAPGLETVMSLALAILALDSYGRPVAGLTDALLSRRREDGGFGTTTMHTAMAATALAASLGENPLIMPARAAALKS